MHVTNLAFSRPDAAHWTELARARPLGLLLDLDGTLIEFAATPEEAILDADAIRALRQLADSGIHVAVVSGRPYETLAPLVAHVPDIWWFAEHGAWAYRDGAWSSPPVVADVLDGLHETVLAMADLPGARIERKSLGICVHWREVAAAARPGFVAAIELACHEWLDGHRDFEHLPGIDHVEIRLRGIDKSNAVQRMRARVPGIRIIAIGDDATDEDMFAELTAGDAAIAVGRRRPLVKVDAGLGTPADVRAFLHWIIDCRVGDTPPTLPLVAIPELRPIRQRSLVVISNRTPSHDAGRQREVGGLVSALEPALRENAGIWLGWSGRERSGESELVIDPLARPARASFDFTPEWREKFYGGFCNRALWPLLHGFEMRVSYRDDEWQAYLAANEAFARHAHQLALPDAPIWVHDFHLFGVAQCLRRLGHRGPIGMFLHTPFPAADAFETMPWHGELLEAMLAFDLVGFHTETWAINFLDTARAHTTARVAGNQVRTADRVTSVGVFPIAIDHAAFAQRAAADPEIAGLRQSLGSRRLLLGVDRLDYAKGIPERLAGFERLLELHPQWRGEVSLVQVSVPSRAEIDDYAQLRRQVETIVGRINGRFGEADWVPVRYLYRSYERDVLAQLYRLADVALVTPLRDGMNLVAKEFVAAQDSRAPGVLVLSRFAGAAHELADAVLTNPLHPDGLAADIDLALRMPAEERARRHALLEAAVRRTSPASWVSSFLRQLVTDRSVMPALSIIPTASPDLDRDTN